MAKEVKNSRSGEIRKTAEDLDKFLNRVRSLFSLSSLGFLLLAFFCLTCLLSLCRLERGSLSPMMKFWALLNYLMMSLLSIISAGCHHDYCDIRRIFSTSLFKWYQYHLFATWEAIIISLLILLLLLSGLGYSACANIWESTQNYSNLILLMHIYVTCSENDSSGKNILLHH